jgi:hypothetical protein
MSIPSRLLKKVGTKAEAAKTSKPAKKPIPVGTDQALSLPLVGNKVLHLTYWDLWFALVAANECGRDLMHLGHKLGSDNSSVFFSRESAERKQSHLLDLGHRLASAGVTIDQVIVAAGDLARTEKRRASKFVLEKELRKWEWSDAMHETARERHTKNALRGSWPRFPISPEPSAIEIWSKFKTKGFYSENASFGLVRKLERFLERGDKLLKKRRYAEAQALLRAWITVVIELIEMADDSYGCIGDCFAAAFETYLNIPLAETGIEEPVFFADLLNFLIWEDYGFTWKQTDGYFHKLSGEQGDFCIAHLRQQIGELSAEFLSYQSEEALTLLGQVVVEQDRFDQFESLAREMGSRHWERIIKLADRAVKKRKRPLACQVFEAALTPGDHSELLQEKYEQLKKGKWNPNPRK